MKRQVHLPEHVHIHNIFALIFILFSVRMESYYILIKDYEDKHFPLV